MNTERAGLGTTSVEYILGVSKTVLDGVVDHGLVNPDSQLGGKGGYEWGKEEIFRAFVATDLIHKYEEQYGSKYPRYKYDQVKRDLLSKIRSNRDNYLDSDAWKEAIERGRERGINLLGMDSK